MTSSPSPTLTVQLRALRRYYYEKMPKELYHSSGPYMQFVKWSDVEDLLVGAGAPEIDQLRAEVARLRAENDKLACESFALVEKLGRLGNHIETRGRRTL